MARTLVMPNVCHASQGPIAIYATLCTRLKGLNPLTKVGDGVIHISNGLVRNDNSLVHAWLDAPCVCNAGYPPFGNLLALRLDTLHANERIVLLDALVYDMWWKLITALRSSNDDCTYVGHEWGIMG